MDRIKIGFIGTGYWGKNLVRAFSFLPEVEICAASDLRETNFGQVRALSPHCKCTTQYQEILQDPEIQGVVIATPSPQHYEVAKAALQAGKHTFVEKPIALKLKEAEDLVSLAKKAGKTLMVGHLLKHHPVTEYLKQSIDRGDLGDINYIYTQRVNLGIIRSDENPLWSLSPHDISLILYFMDEMPSEVFAHGASFLQQGIEDVIFAGMSFPSGRLAHLHLSWLDPHKIRSITIVGSKKMAVFNDMEPREKLRIYDKGMSKQQNPESLMEYISLRDGDISIPKIEAKEPLRLECQNFVDCLKGKARSKSDAPEAVRILKVITLLDESLKNSGKPISVS